MSNRLGRRAALQTSLALAAAPNVKAASKSTTPDTASPVVETTAGKVRGFTSAGVSVFRGIPYAATTTAENRFAPPKKAEPWPGVRNCFSYGHTCPGAGTGVIENDRNSRNTDEDEFLLYRTKGWVRGEDCLRVNVFTPAGNSNHKRPVMVYMHGGGFAGGSGNDLLSYDGENLARHHDVVVVTHNHRLNLFGYLNLAEVGGERYAASGNVGMLDIVAVLEWVRDNIAQFGGDPNNVLIFGQSGGGGKVNALLAMPAAKGLFHRAAVQSGSMLRFGAPEATAKFAAAVLEELGISKNNLDKIHQIPTSALSAVQVAVVRKLAATAGPGRGVNWGPIVDGKILPAHPYDPVATPLGANIPLLIGTCLNEFVNGTDNPERDTLTEAQLHTRVQERYAGKAGDIIAAYKKEYPKESPFGIWAAISAAMPRQNAIKQAERKAAQGGAPVYMYLYAWRTPMLGGNIGTFHSSEIAFVFDNATLCNHYGGTGPNALALSSKMGAAWAALARTGKPGHNGLPNWPAYNAQTRSTMVFDTPCAVRNNPEGAGLKLIG